MGEVIKFRKLKPGERHAGKMLCKSGFHKWSAVPHKQFDVRQGKLVTWYKCERCGATRTART